MTTDCERGPLKSLQTDAASAWFSYLCMEGDRAIKNVLKRNQCLLYVPIGFLAGKSCECTNNFERMCPGGSSESLHDFTTKHRRNIALGHCEHAVWPSEHVECSEIQSSEVIIPDLKEASREDQDRLFDVFIRGNPFCAHTTPNVTWVYLVHILTAKGNIKALKYSLKNLNPNVPAVFFTRRNKLSVSYLAVLHRRYRTLKSVLSNDVLHRLMSAKTVSQYMEKKNCHLLLAVHRDDVRAVTSIVEAQGVRYESDSPLETKPLMSEMLSEAFRTNSTKVIKYFIRLKDSGYWFSDLATVDSILQVVMEGNSVSLLQLLLKHSPIQIDLLLQAAVDYDNVGVVQTILEAGEKRGETFYPDYLPVVLHRSTKMLDILIKCPDVTPGTITDYYENFRLTRAVMWSKFLKFDDCTSMMERKETFPRIDIENEKFKLHHPLTDVFHIDIKSSKLPRTKLIRHLLSIGCSVNSKNHYNTTPIMKAFKLADYKAARVLLLAGADPCLGDGCFDALFCRDVIKVILYVNTDIYSNSRCMQCIANFGISGCRSTAEASRLFIQTIRSLHTLSSDLREHLSRRLQGPAKKTMLEEHRQELERILNRPRPLIILCRNRLRQHYGIRIHCFVKSVVVPSTVREMVLLEDWLNDVGT